MNILKSLSINLLMVLSLSLLVMTGTSRGERETGSRQRLLMDFNWLFKLGDQKGAEEYSFDDNSWRKLNLPHDWSIEGEFSKEAPAGGNGGYLPTGNGWYQEAF